MPPKAYEARTAQSQRQLNEAEQFMQIPQGHVEVRKKKKALFLADRKQIDLDCKRA